MDKSIDKRVPIGPDEQLEEQVRQDLSCLFSDFGGRVTSNRHLPGIGNAAIIIEADNLRFRIVKNCAQIRFTMAPSRNSRDWKNVGVVLWDFADRPSFDFVPISLAEAGERLRPELAQLNDAFSKAQHRITERRLKQTAKMRLAGVRTRPKYRSSPVFAVVDFLAPVLRPGLKLIAEIFHSIFPGTRNANEPSGSNETFLKQVKEELAFLFSDYGAEIISSCYYYYSFGRSCVALDAGNLRLRLREDRGSLGADFAALQEPWISWSVSYGLTVINTKDGLIPQRLSFRTVRQLAEILQPKFRDLSQSLSAENYAETKHRLELIKEASKKAYDDELKRRQQECKIYDSSGTLGQRP